MHTRKLAALALPLALVACSSSSGSATKGADSGPAACTDPTLTLAFSPMYSAVVPGDDTHTFELPVIVAGANGKTFEWSASDPTAVAITNDPVTGGALLTMRSTAKSPGAPVTITATSGSACGTAVLNITVATNAEWSAGEARYNDHVAVDGGNRAACTDCHSPRVDAGVGYDDVAHTPQQAGGFSDSQLLSIIQDAVVPDGGYFDSNIVTYEKWQTFHKWDLTAAEQAGIVVYLRSLVPTAQGGTANFGGKGVHAGDGG